MTRDEAIKQLDWYFNEDDGIAADDKTHAAYAAIRIIGFDYGGYHTESQSKMRCTMSDLFPTPDDTNMPRRIWETYEIMVGVCNSLNAQAGRFAYTDISLYNQLLKAQKVISILLDESGRREEFEDWDRKVDKW